MFSDITGWRFADNFAGRPLADIPCLSDRARSLFVRTLDAPILKRGWINIFGAIDMMRGLDYHAERFSEICKSLARDLSAGEDSLSHEAVAYLNRAGQFHTFARSEYVTQVFPAAIELIPSISRIMIFRNKHAAHRSIDAPRGEEDAEHWRHAMATGALGMRLFSPRPGKAFNPELEGVIDLATLRKKLWESSYWTINTYDAEKQEQINFILEEEHGMIIGEAYSLIERLMAWKE
jgi:hypothetical protein